MPANAGPGQVRTRSCPGQRRLPGLGWHGGRSREILDCWPGFSKLLAFLTVVRRQRGIHAVNPATRPWKPRVRSRASAGARGLPRSVEGGLDGRVRWAEPTAFQETCAPRSRSVDGGSKRAPPCQRTGKPEGPICGQANLVARDCLGLPSGPLPVTKSHEFGVFSSSDCSRERLAQALFGTMALLDTGLGKRPSVAASAPCSRGSSGRWSGSCRSFPAW